MLPATFLVTSNADDGTANTLRWAIDQANLRPGFDTIAFKIAGAQPETITLDATLGALPPITDAVFIDGWSQGQNPIVNAPQVEIDGSALGGMASGLDVQSGGTMITGLAIDGFASNGIELNNAPGSAGSIVFNCYIGCGLSGESGFSGNRGDGILITGPGNSVGLAGTAMPPAMEGMPFLIGAWNVISGNGAAGVRIDGSAATANFLSGNFIGVDATGFAALPNFIDGVRIQGGASNNYVGFQPPQVGFENLISGNGAEGVSIVGSSNNFVGGSYIGVAADGETPIDNSLDGVLVSGASANNRIENDTISGNRGSGVRFSGPGATGNTIDGSCIGTDYTGMLARGNGGDGVTLDGDTSNTVGGGMGLYNVISGNLGSGIDITGTLDKVYGNWIGTDENGLDAVPNQLNGVTITGSNNTIGSPLVPSSNTVSGNLGSGIAIEGDGNRVYGNNIGTNDAGTAAIANGGNGVAIQGSNNYIGTATAVGGNLISGNTASGVYIYGDSNEIYGNTIGTNRAEAAALANGANGVTIYGNSNRVGTTGALVENLISGNANDGVYIEGGSNKVYGNQIGTDSIGWDAIANGNNGVEVKGNNNEVGSDLIGGGNLISGNRNDGVYIYGDVNTVAAGLIGVTSYGTADLANGGVGVEINFGVNNIIGIKDQTGGNVISGNGTDGVRLGGSPSNVIANNYIGVGADGETAVGNGRSGIRIDSGGANIIGGEQAWNANVISANGSYGLFVSGATGTIIKGNFIGVGVDGMTALGNRLDGILIQSVPTSLNAAGQVVDGPPNFIGGPGAAGNVICNNGGYGVELNYNARNCTVQNNWIGVYFNEMDGWIDAPNTLGWMKDAGAGNTWTADNEHD